MDLHDLTKEICDTLQEHYGKVRLGDTVRVYNKFGKVTRISHGEAIVNCEGAIFHTQLSTLRKVGRKRWRRHSRR